MAERVGSVPERQHAGQALALYVAQPISEQMVPQLCQEKLGVALEHCTLLPPKRCCKAQVYLMICKWGKDHT